MPRGPKGEKRPAEVIGAAIMVAKIATGEIEDTFTEKNPHAAAWEKLGGAKGGNARALPRKPPAPVVLSMADVVTMIEVREGPAKRRGPYKKRGNVEEISN
jgi:hypothetical protein